MELSLAKDVEAVPRLLGGSLSLHLLAWVAGMVVGFSTRGLSPQLSQCNVS